MEFDTDDNVAEQSKNANDVKAEGKVSVRKRQYTTINLVVMKRKESMRTQKNLRKPKMATRIQAKMMKMIRLWSPMK